jgi:tripartite-type tricarboxylate transporter receptor subunit TctC
MSKFVWVLAALSLLLLGSTFGCSQSDSKNDVESFYKGKTVDLVTNSSTGGFDDLVSRTIASYLGKDTGSNVIVVSKSGAAGLDGINFAYTAQPDGLTFFTTAASKLIGSKVMREPAAAYDLDKFKYILKVGNQVQYFFVSPDGPIQSLNDLKSAKNIKLGGSSPSGNISLAGLSLIKILNLDAKLITGFSSESERALAVKRGETIGYFIPYLSAKSSVEAGLTKPLFVLASQRDSLRLDVPAITELTEITGENLELVKFWETEFTASLIFAAPPGLSDDKLEYLRNTAGKWSQDQNFQQDLKKVFGYDVTYFETGDQVTQSMSRLADSTNSYYDLFSDLIAKYRN